MLSESQPRYPEIYLPYVSTDGPEGNAFAIMARVDNALRDGGVPKLERDTFKSECMSGDYNHLLETVMDWVRCTPWKATDYD